MFDECSHGGAREAPQTTRKHHRTTGLVVPSSKAVVLGALPNIDQRARNVWKTRIPWSRSQGIDSAPVLAAAEACLPATADRFPNLGLMIPLRQDWALG